MSEITVSKRKEDPVMSAERMSDFRQRKISSRESGGRGVGGGGVLLFTHTGNRTSI